VIQPARSAHVVAAVAPIAVGVIVAVLPVPTGLTPGAWRYFRAVCRRRGWTDGRAAAGGGHWFHRYGAGSCLAAGGGRSRRLVEMGPQRILQRHRLARVRGIHDRARLREDRPRPAARAAAGAPARRAYAGPGLRRGAGRPRHGALHALEHGPQRRHDLFRSRAAFRHCMDRSPVRRPGASAATCCGPRSPRRR